MTTVNMLEVNSSLSRLVDAVETGRESEIVIARNGRPAAKLASIDIRPAGTRIGIAPGRFVCPVDIDATLKRSPPCSLALLGEIAARHASVLWAIADGDRLSSHARALIEDRENEVSGSAATLWEIAIKRAPHREGPNGMAVSADEALGYFRAAGYALLDITPPHAAAVGGLPAYHADPFDRLLVAWPMTVRLRLVTADAKILRYGEMMLAV